MKSNFMASLAVLITATVFVTGCGPDHIVYNQEPAPAPPPVMYQQAPPPPAYVYAPAPQVMYAPPAPVYVTAPPPPPYAETIPYCPGPDFVWIGGNWVWHGHWVWEHGRWAQPPHRGCVWHPHHYENHGGVQIFIGGYWH